MPLHPHRPQLLVFGRRSGRTLLDCSVMHDHGPGPVSNHGRRDQSSVLFQSVYDRLRALARSRMAQERADHTLQPTALVHEVFLRMMGGSAAAQHAWNDRAQFYAVAADAMRRILVDAARRRRRLKRAGSRKRVDLDEVAPCDTAPMNDLLALNDALDVLAARHPQKAELVKLRYFAGLTLDEASKALGISNATADRHWAFARAWLYRHMEDSGGAVSRPNLDCENA